MRTARGPLLLGHATLGPEPWGSPRPPDVQPVSEPCELPRPVAWPTQPLRARGQPSSHPLFRRMNGALAPCFPAISRHSRPRPTSSPRPAEPWGTGPCSLPPASQHAPTPQDRPPCRGFWARRAGSPTLLPHTAGVGVAGRLPPPPGLGTGGTPSSRKTPPSAHAVPVTPPRAQIRTSGALRTRVLAVALTLVASQGHISVWHTERAPKEFSNE